MPIDLQNMMRYRNSRHMESYAANRGAGDDVNGKSVANKDWYVRGKAARQAFDSGVQSFGAGYMTGAAVTVAGVVTGVAAAPLVPAVLAAGGVAAYMVNRARGAGSDAPSNIGIDGQSTGRRSAKEWAAELEAASVVKGGAVCAHHAVGLRQRALKRCYSAGDVPCGAPQPAVSGPSNRPVTAAGQRVAHLAAEGRQAKVSSEKIF